MNEQLRIIFLDMDGVVTTFRAGHGRGLAPGNFDDFYDPIVIGLIKKLVKDHNARIVLSSTWRMRGKLALEQLAKMGFDIENEFYTKDPFTPVIASGHRPDEITQWLMKRWHDMVGGFIVLDDDSEGMREQFGERFIHCPGYNGLTFEGYQQAVKIFSGGKVPTKRESGVS